MNLIIYKKDDVKQCAQKCHKLIKIQDEYFRESAPLKISFNENSTSLNPLEDEFEEEIQKYNTSSKKSNFQTLQSDLMKNLKTSQFEDKKVKYILMYTFNNIKRLITIMIK